MNSTRWFLVEAFNARNSIHVNVGNFYEQGEVEMPVVQVSREKNIIPGSFVVAEAIENGLDP